MSKLKEKWKQTGRRQKAIFLIPLCCLLIAAICTGGIFIAFHKGDTGEADVQQADDLSALGMTSATNMEDVITGDGSLVYGTLAQNYDITISGNGNSAASLQIEEVYVEAGDTVAEGDDIYKLTDDSVSQVRTLLEKALTNAENSLEEAQMSYDEQSLEAKYTYIEDSGMEETELAEYEEKVNEINKAVEDALTEYENAIDITETYPDTITKLNEQLTTLQTELESSSNALKSAEDSLKSAQKVYDSEYSSYQQALENLKAIAATYKYLLAYTDQDTSIVSSIEISKYDTASSSEISSIVPDNAVNTDLTLNALINTIGKQYESSLKDYNTAKKEFDSAAKTLQETESAQKTAQESSEKINTQVKETEQSISQYESELGDAENNLSTLKTNYESAKLQSESNLLDAQNDYDVNVLTYTNAKYNYDKTVSELDNTLQEAKDAVTDASNNLDSFEELVGDGIIKASQEGTVSSVPYEADDYISTGALIYYINSDDLTVTVTVAQEDIALVNVGDEAVVYASDSGIFSGTVSTVASESESESVSNVTYDVTLAVTDGNGLSGGTDVSVYFNMSLDSMQTGGMKKGEQATE